MLYRGSRRRDITRHRRCRASQRWPSACRHVWFAVRFHTAFDVMLTHDIRCIAAQGRPVFAIRPLFDVRQLKGIGPAKCRVIDSRAHRPFPRHDYTISHTSDRMAWPCRHVAHRARAARQPVGRGSARRRSGCCRSVLGGSALERCCACHSRRSACRLRLLRSARRSRCHIRASPSAARTRHARGDGGGARALHPLYAARRLRVRPPQSTPRLFLTLSQQAS
jgi:hypothetical protein